MQSAQLFTEALPAFRISGGMGSSTLADGFDPGAVEALFRLRGLTAECQRQTWDDLTDMAIETRLVLAEQREEQAKKQKDDKDDKPKRIGHGRTLKSLLD
jgi:hypothetical protein